MNTYVFESFNLKARVKEIGINFGSLGVGYLLTGAAIRKNNTDGSQL